MAPYRPCRLRAAHAARQRARRTRGRVRRRGRRGAARASQPQARRRHSHWRSEFRHSDPPRQRTRSAGDRRWPWTPRAHVASGSRRNKTGAAGLAGPLDDPSCDGRPGRRAGQFHRPGFHGSGETDVPSSRLGCSLPPRHFARFQSRSRSLRRVPDAGRIAVAGRRRGGRRQRCAGFRRAQARDACHSQGDWRDRIRRRRPRARRVYDRGVDRGARRRGSRLGDPVRGQLAVRILAADPACALGRARPHRARPHLRPFDCARLLGSLARTRARCARDDAHPRHDRGTARLASHAIHGRRRSGGRRPGRARRPRQSAAVDRCDDSRRDHRGVSRAEAHRLRDRFPCATGAAVALR